jgi:hypothetical protein
MDMAVGESGHQRAASKDNPLRTLSRFAARLYGVCITDQDNAAMPLDEVAANRMPRIAGDDRPFVNVGSVVHGDLLRHIDMLGGWRGIIQWRTMMKKRINS